VRVLVPAGAAHGVIEGSSETLSISTVDALACANGTQIATTDPHGHILDLGREQRLYTARQRIALAIRDGGCMWPDCDRPPTWCEAHHIHHWANGGRTDLSLGILLCRHHHLRLHNQNGNIRLHDGRYWLQPPPDTGEAPTLLVTKSRAMREHLARHKSPSAALVPA
jgi:hypothetical protein